MRKKFNPKTFIVVRTLANALIISGVVFAFLGIWPYLSSELNYRLSTLWQKPKVLGIQTVDSKPKGPDLPPLGVEPVDKNFGIIIEKILVNAPVVPEVDPALPKDYVTALKKGAAHAKGTAFPGSKGAKNNNVFIFAHSTLNPWDVPKYNAIFYLLRKLEVGDRITTFYQGKRYDYIVYDKKVVGAKDVRYLTEPSAEPVLTLQTCDPPGTQLRRLIITANLVD